MPVLANSAISQDAYQAESEKIRERFEQSHNGQIAIRERTTLTDSFITELWNQFSPASADRICVAALGGYGRRALFPCSDVDVLFLHESALSGSFRQFPRRSGTCIFGSAPPPVPWRSAASCTVTISNSTFPCWTAVTFAATRDCLSSFTRK